MCTRYSPARINKWARERNAAAGFVNRQIAAEAPSASTRKALNGNRIWERSGGPPGAARRPRQRSVGTLIGAQLVRPIRMQSCTLRISASVLNSQKPHQISNPTSTIAARLARMR